MSSIAPGTPDETALLSLVAQRQTGAALNAARALTENFPQRAFGWKVLGALLWAVGSPQEAVQAMEAAVRLTPDDAEANCNLGTTLAKLQRFDGAHFYLGRAIALEPTSAAAHYRRGMAYDMQGRYADAEASIRCALSLRSGSLTGDDELGLSNLLFMLSHNPHIDAGALFAEHRQVGELLEAAHHAVQPRPGDSFDPDRCLRVGIVSGDFNDHAVASFCEPVLEHLGASRGLDLHAYYNKDSADDTTRRLRTYFHRWNVVADRSDEQLAQSIRDDHIDILIDLSGHTALNRLGVFARRPAPLQVSWLGYVGTTGLRAMDYYLSDRHFLPHDEFQAQFTERLVHLPAAAAFLPHAASPPVNKLPAIDAGTVTFGSFNRLGKINGRTLERWARLLRAVPGARMLLGGIAEGQERASLLDRFAACGIAGDRIVLHARAPMDVYLALHHRVDLCLDTQPWTGGATTNHALWMGVPTLTLTGTTPASRLSAALLGQVGLTAFIAHDDEQFLELGVYWATHLRELAAVRSSLRDRCARSPARQPAIIARALESALRVMWTRRCAGLPPQFFAIEELLEFPA